MAEAPEHFCKVQERNVTILNESVHLFLNLYLIIGISRVRSISQEFSPADVFSIWIDS